MMKLPENLPSEQEPNLPARGMTPNVKNIEQKKLADCQYSEYLTLLTSSLNVKESDQGGTGEHENRELVDRPPRFIS
jgi:hypothetical protein